MRINPRIRKRMATTPVIIHVMSEKDSVGDVIEEEDFGLFGYVFDETVTVINHLGMEEVSNRQVYLFEGDILRVDPSMKVSVKETVKARIVRRQAYDGPYSKTMMGVLYLP